MGRIAVEFAALEDGERGFREALEQFETTLNRLDAEVKDSLGQWEGPARDAYQVFHDNWHKSARVLHEELDRLHRAIVGAHQNYRGAFDANLRMWRA